MLSLGLSNNFLQIASLLSACFSESSWQTYLGFLICKTKFVKLSNNGWLRRPKLASQYASDSVWLLLNALNKVSLNGADGLRFCQTWNHSAAMVLETITGPSISHIFMLLLLRLDVVSNNGARYRELRFFRPPFCGFLSKIIF